MNDYLEQQRKKALQLDNEDPLREFRDLFSIPTNETSGKQKIYFCNNSLGLPPKKSFTLMNEQMERWASLGIEGWFTGDKNWYSSLNVPLREPLARLLGAKFDEVVVMNSLTVNLHLLMVSFYQPTRQRYKILIDSPTFPSDLYAMKSHIRHHGLDPEEALIILEPRPGEFLLRQEDIQHAILKNGGAIALVFLNNVNFLTGQALDMKVLSNLAHEQGCVVGCDVAHAAGNIPLELHEWKIDFAVGCSYKYLCSGPGGPGIAFVHSSHHDTHLPRFSGWWGNDPNKRFQMQLEPEFIPYGGAYSWQVSTPSILAMTPLLASLEILDRAGSNRFRKKSELQTAFLLELLDSMPSQNFEVVTPRAPSERGCQLSLLIRNDPEAYLADLEKNDVTCDFRKPNIIRVTPSPLYNTFKEIFEFAIRLGHCPINKNEASETAENL